MSTVCEDRIRDDIVEAADVPVRRTELHAITTRTPPMVSSPPSRSRDLLKRVAVGVIPFLSHRAQYIGRLGVIGVALLIFSLVCFLSANSALHRELAGLQSDLAREQRDQAASRRAGTAVALDTQSLAFINELPARAELPAITARIYGQASAVGIVLDRGSYDFHVTHSGRIVRAQMSFPVVGTYPNIRRFVTGTLTAIPGVAVDGLKVERKSIGAAEISAEIRFTVFLRNGP